MKSVHSSSLVLMLVAAAIVGACGADEPSTSTTPDPVGAVPGGPGGTTAGPGATTGGPGATTGGPAVSTTGGTTPGDTAGPGGTTGGPSTLTMNKPCEKKVSNAGKTVPDFMIVLDRSGSMRPMAGLNCAMPDIATVWICLGLGIDCTNPMMANTANCGGMQAGTDRWTPAVAAVKSLTSMFQDKVSFGLTTFPGQGASQQPGGNNGCAAGTQRVPVGTKTAAAIAAALDMTQPDGFTPTGPTLQAVLQQIQAKKTSPDAEVPPQYVLLVTDGAPTCPGNNNGQTNPQAHQATVAAIDALAKAGVKTFVIGYDATVDPNLAKQLTEYAMHGGTNNFFAVQDGPSLVTKFTEITNVVAECTYTLDKKPDDKMFVRVELDKEALPNDSPDGWSINDKTVTINGAACTKLRDGTKPHTLAVTVECTPQIIN